MTTMTPVERPLLEAFEAGRGSVPFDGEGRGEPSVGVGDGMSGLNVAPVLNGSVMEGKPTFVAVLVLGRGVRRGAELVGVVSMIVVEVVVDVVVTTSVDVVEGVDEAGGGGGGGGCDVDVGLGLEGGGGGLLEGEGVGVGGGLGGATTAFVVVGLGGAGGAAVVVGFSGFAGGSETGYRQRLLLAKVL